MRERSIRRSGRHALGILAVTCLLTMAGQALAIDYEVGPGQTYAAIGEVPWESLAPGDRVLIHWRDTPYKEKWVIGRSGTADQPIVIHGVPAPDGSLPVIDGQDATTRGALDYTNEARGVIKIGTSNVPPETIPSHIVIEGLEVRSGRPPFSFTDPGGDSQSYSDSAASIYVEVAQHLTVRNCIIRDSANGLFIGVRGGDTQDILIEGNWIYDNGVEGSVYQHNSYTAALGIVFQYNHYGPLRADCGGNNLKDRSAGLVVRYNWLEGGNRQLDLVDGEDHPSVPNAPDYHQTFVYGNLLYEPVDDGNSQMVHYGGDSGDETIYRKGTLYFFNNTVVSGRSGNTTLLRLSTNEEHADVRNNIVYARAGGGYLAMVGSSGTLDVAGNWLSSGWTTSHDTFDGTLNDLGNNIDGETTPGFADETGEDFGLAAASSCIDAAIDQSPDVLPAHEVLNQYVKHRSGMQRPQVGNLDVGAFEYCESDCPDPDGGVVDQPDGGSSSSSSSSGTTSSSGGTSSGSNNADGSGDDGGCGCRIGPARGIGAALISWLALIALMRRRSRR